MSTIQRRNALSRIAAGSAAAIGAFGLPSLLWAQTAKKPKLASKLRILIPATTRVNLDDAGRALGDALVFSDLCDEVEYENVDGKGGTTGLALYAEKYASDPNTVMVGDSSLVSAIALHKPAVDLSRVQPVARLTNTYLVVAVPAASPVKNAAELAGRLRSNPAQSPIAIGPAGGAEHVFAALLNKSASAAPGTTVYMPFARNFEMVDAVMSGKAVAAISGYRTFAPELAQGKLRAVGLSSQRSYYGIPSFKEQGLDVDMANWRAVFTGKNVPPARAAEMVDALKTVSTADSWKKALKDNYWEPSWLTGADFANFVDLDAKTLQVIVQLLKLKA